MPLKLPIQLLIVVVSIFAGAFSASAHTLVRPPVKKPSATTITEPEWERLPGPDDFSRLYPQLANMMRLDGQVRITCIVSDKGEMQDCRVDSEVPAGVGFGQAALLMAPSFKMKPQLVDGLPVAGANVTVPIRFSIDYSAITDADVFELLNAPSLTSPVALTLSRQIINAHNPYSTGRNYYEGIARDLLKEFGLLKQDQASPSNQAALTALGEAYTIANQAINEARARRLADTLTIPQLEKILGFIHSDVGVAWLAEIKTEGETERLTSAAFQTYIGEDAGRRFCRRVKCPDNAPATDRPPSTPPEKH